MAPIPFGFVPLGEAFEEIVRNSAPPSNVLEPRAKWALGVIHRKAVIGRLKTALQSRHAPNHLPVWTRERPDVELERIDPLALAMSSLNWDLTIRSGRVVVRSDPYIEDMKGWPLYVKRSDLNRIRKHLGDTSGRGSRPPRLPQADLLTWWNSLNEEERGRSQPDLHAMAKKEFPQHTVARDRVRDLTAGRKRGPRPTR